MDDEELANAIVLLAEAHYKYCKHGDWSEECPIFKAWEKRRTFGYELK